MQIARIGMRQLRTIVSGGVLVSAILGLSALLGLNLEVEGPHQRCVASTATRPDVHQGSGMWLAGREADHASATAAACNCQDQKAPLTFWRFNTTSTQRPPRPVHLALPCALTRQLAHPWLTR